MSFQPITRLEKILMGQNTKAITRLETAVKYAVDNAGSGGGSDLPAVTADDNGDVLTVVEGAWAKADAPSGLPAVSGSDNGKVLTVSSGAWTAVLPASDIVRVPFTLTAGEGGIVATTSASFADTMTAFAAHKTIIAEAILQNDTTEMHIIGVMSGNVDSVTSANNMLYVSVPYYDGDQHTHVLATIIWGAGGAVASQVTLTTT